MQCRENLNVGLDFHSLKPAFILVQPIGSYSKYASINFKQDMCAGEHKGNYNSRSGHFYLVLFHLYWSLVRIIMHTTGYPLLNFTPLFSKARCVSSYLTSSACIQVSAFIHVSWPVESYPCERCARVGIYSKIHSFINGKLNV